MEKKFFKKIAFKQKTSPRRIAKEVTQSGWKMRYIFTCCLFLLAFIGLSGRIIQLHLVENDFLQAQGDARTTRTVALPAARGVITDRNHEPLAVSAPVDSVWINLQEYEEAGNHTLNKLAKMLDTTVADLKKRFKNSKSRDFLYLKRHIDPSVGERVAALEIPGVYVQREYRRYYPMGEIGAHLIGMTDVDGVGQEGIELAYENALAGSVGAKTVMKDRLGRTIEDIKLLRPSETGETVTLSIDRRLQYLAYRELKAVVTEHRAQGGSLVLLDAKTGEILAMVNQPSFNPNNRTSFQAAAIRNRAVTDVFEPGSVIKPLVMLAALQNNTISRDTEIDTSPGVMMIQDKTVRDIRNYGVMSLRMILRKSSNVGMAKLVANLPPRELEKTLLQLGLGRSTDSTLPGERSGQVIISDNIDPFSYATMAFGYGLSVTPLQLAKAYAIMASDGKDIAISPVKMGTELPKRQQAVDAKAARAVRNMIIIQADDEGTGQNARISGYSVAGKSGTSRKVGAQGYDAEKHFSTFAGFAPASNPRLVLVVMIDEPATGEHFGGVVAAPVFSSVMSAALSLLNIPPDEVPQHE